MTNVMHKFLIYLSIYFFLTCFGFSFSTSSEAGIQLRLWFKSPGYGVSARAQALTPYPGD
jgi:preprotein translocase subunit SecG